MSSTKYVDQQPTIFGAASGPDPEELDPRGSGAPPTARIITGDAADVARELAAAGETFHASLSDPPYGIDFMAKGWDTDVPPPELWRSVRAALAPGAMILAFGGTRAFHHTALGIERGGFEIRDCLCWLYGQGFPKNHDVAKAMSRADESAESAERWRGWGTALKPGWEPVVLAQNPRPNTFARTALEHHAGALAIDASRLGEDGEGRWPANVLLTHTPECRCVGTKRVKTGTTNQDNIKATSAIFGKGLGGAGLSGVAGYADEDGKEEVEAWECAEGCPIAMLDEQAGDRPSTLTGRIDEASGEHPSKAKRSEANVYGIGFNDPGSRVYADSGGPSRFFYCPKASRREREAGLEDFEPGTVSDGRDKAIENPYQRGKTTRRNLHPTVKPLDLLRYLAGLLLLPETLGGSVLEPRRILVPFAGSGSEMIGAALAGWDHVTGIELNREYAEIAAARIRHHCPEHEVELFEM